MPCRAVEWLRLHASIAEGTVQSLVRELRSSMLQGVQNPPPQILIYTNRSFYGITSKIINNILRRAL